MNQAIAEIIRTRIETKNFDWIGKVAGLVTAVTIEVRGPDNTTLQKTFPVGCDVTADDCKEGAYNDLMPNSAYNSVIYFEDKGITFDDYKKGFKYYTSNLRLVGWINTPKICGNDCKEGPCAYAAKVVTDIIKSFPLFPAHEDPFSFLYSEVTEQEPKTNAIFSKYTYDEVHSQYLIGPYDYFALNIKTVFAICLNGRVSDPCN
jgi:hypothetical protein